MPTSWKPEVQTDSTGKWYGNALRFSTKEEAEANVKDLERRWTTVRATRATESNDPVNYKWENGRLEEIPSAAKLLDAVIRTFPSKGDDHADR